jgi:hypothetical protein
MGGRCSLHGVDEKCAKNVVTKSERRYYFGNLNFYIVDILFHFHVFHNCVLLNRLINRRFIMNRNKY